MKNVENFTPTIPPIFLEGTKLQDQTSNRALTARVYKNSEIRLQCIDLDLYRVVQNFLSKYKANFYIPLQENKPLKVVVKGLLPDIIEQELGNELKSLGFEVLYVKQFGNATRKFPIHIITFASNPSSKVIFQKNSFFYLLVKIKS